MLKTIIFTVVLFSFVACDLDKLEPAQTKAFMKFFGDIGNTEGVDLLKLDDGYLLLGNNTNGGLETALLIKTDLNGNTIWSAYFENISASALAKNDNSYFIVGDSINNNNLPDNNLPYTRMSLIKTDLDGRNHEYKSLGVTNVPYHGTGITVSRSDQVVVCGYINGLLSGTDTTFLYSYDFSLTPAWSAVRKWQTDGDIRISSKTLIQDDDDNFVYTTMYGSSNSIEAIIAAEDSPTPLAMDILKDFNSTNEPGDFYLNSFDNNGALVQTVINNGNKDIAFVTYDSLAVRTVLLSPNTAKNYYASTVVHASGSEYVVLGSTDDHGQSSRSDLDFYITKVGVDGSVSSISGFTSIIGGTGDETGAAIVQAEDRGFVFIGTMHNTSDVKIMVLMKVDVNGNMIN